MAKVLLINCSPRKAGNTYLALEEAAKELQKEGIETEITGIGAKPVRGCIGCYSCKKEGAKGCVFDDDVANVIAEKALAADAFIVGSPVYYGLPTGQAVALVQRMFVSAGDAFKFKPVANVAVCRRGGATAALEAMNMPWMMMNCPVVSSSYWNIVYGQQAGEAAKDAEGMQVMRMLARNMARVIRGLSREEKPVLEPQERTNFIR